jgi:hypothetical protein
MYWNFDACTIVQLGGTFVLILGRIIHPGAMNKGNIFSLERVSRTPQPDGSVVKTVYSNTWALYNHIPSGIMVLKRAASASLIMSLYLSNQVPTWYDYHRYFLVLCSVIHCNIVRTSPNRWCQSVRVWYSWRTDGCLRTIRAVQLSKLLNRWALNIIRRISSFDVCSFVLYLAITLKVFKPWLLDSA